MFIELSGNVSTSNQGSSGRGRSRRSGSLKPWFPHKTHRRCSYLAEKECAHTGNLQLILIARRTLFISKF